MQANFNNESQFVLMPWVFQGETEAHKAAAARKVQGRAGADHGLEFR